MGWIDSQITWLQDPKYLLPIMIMVSLWMSFSVGFLAMLAGLQTVNRELYEAGRIDGLSNRLQEVFYITIPSMKPQMLFSAVMTIVSTLKAGSISTQLTGMAVTPQYAGHLIINHVDDYAFIRFELGYASAVSVMLLLFSYFVMRFAYRLFNSKEEL
jgi:multiple sugar transport system permease protein